MDSEHADNQHCEHMEEEYYAAFRCQTVIGEDGEYQMFLLDGEDGELLRFKLGDAIPENPECPVCESCKPITYIST